MHFVFFSSRVPLTKTIVAEHGRFTATPYPHVSAVTSHENEVKSIRDFAPVLKEHALQGHCLFGGHLTHPLVSESRAGKTRTTDRRWICFDFDGVEAQDHADVVKRYLPPECQGVSYVVQLSSRMFRPDTTLWSGHIFMVLKEPRSEKDIKQWFEYLNFTQSSLASQLSLSDSLQALHWPLDRTVAYNSKLIYIAPPKCIGFEPVKHEPITLVKKSKDALTISSFQPIDSQTIRQKINELRRNIGEPEIQYELVQHDGHDVLKSSEFCDIQGIKASGDHYIRFNLNGGDSYAYFIDLRNPDLIKNFKGEPFLLTKDAAPDLYKSLRRAAPKALQKPPLQDGSDVLAFYATNQSSKLKIGLYNGESQEMELNSASQDSARAWLWEYGLVQKDPFPHRYLIFDPTKDEGYVPTGTTINTFSPTLYMTAARDAQASTLRDLPPIANKVIRSALGPCTEDVLKHFVNWMAYLVQRRDKSQTAWVLNGVPGSGKNSLVKYYLRPILGNKHVTSIQYPALTKEFNGFLEQSILCVIEEANINGVDNQDEVMAKMLHYVTDSPITIRRMNTEHYEAPNYTNFLLFTNTRTPVKVSSNDRRLNFGEYQDQRWYPTPNEIETMAKGTELEAFADFLMRWPLDAYAVTQIVETQARADAHEATTSINQLVADALSKGDLQFFIDRLPSEAEALSDFGNRFNPTGLFSSQLDKYIEAADRGQEIIVPENEIFILFRTLIPDNRFLQDSKTWRKRHYKTLGLDVDKQHRVGAARVRGIKVQWKKPDTRPDKTDESNVTPISKRSKK